MKTPIMIMLCIHCHLDEDSHHDHVGSSRQEGSEPARSPSSESPASKRCHCEVRMVAVEGWSTSHVSNIVQNC